jgi:hypothetical protein
MIISTTCNVTDSSDKVTNREQSRESHTDWHSDSDCHTRGCLIDCFHWPVLSMCGGVCRFEQPIQNGVQVELMSCTCNSIKLSMIKSLAQNTNRRCERLDRWAHACDRWEGSGQESWNRHVCGCVLFVQTDTYACMHAAFHGCPLA